MPSHLYIAEGFLEDCEELIHTLTERHEIVDWHKFCKCWKEMDFDKLFYGGLSSPELVEFTEEILQISRLYLVTETDNFESQVIGLFIAYAITEIQPHKNLCSLRIVPKDIPALKKIEAMARRDKRQDILIILGKMYICGKVHFHVFERERAMDFTIRKYYDDSVRVPRCIARRWRGELGRPDLRAFQDVAAEEERYYDLKLKSKMVAEQIIPGLNVKLDTYKPDGKRIAESLRTLISGDSTKKDDDEESHVNSVKQKAMKKTVDSMRHLSSVAERKKRKEPTEISPKPSTSKVKKKSNKINLLSPDGPTNEASEQRNSVNSLSELSLPGFSLPSLSLPDSLPCLDDPSETEERRKDREGSPEAPFKGFTTQEIDTSDYNTLGEGKVKGKGKSSKPQNETASVEKPVDISPGHNRKRKLNFTGQDNKKKRKPKNVNNTKLKLFSLDTDDDESKQSKKICNDVVVHDKCNEKEITVVDSTSNGKEITIQSKGVVKHFVEYEVSDIVIRAEKDATPRDIEIEYIDNYTGANALYEEICELSDEEETKKDKKISKDTVKDSVTEKRDEIAANDDNMEIFDVVVEGATNTPKSGKKTNAARYNDEVNDTMRKILRKNTRKVDRRKLKLPNLKSKLKKLGILPVTNLDSDFK